MTSCPSCQKSIQISEEHYGTLFKCSFCGSEFFVDFSGTPENSKEPLPETPQIPPVSELVNLQPEIDPPPGSESLASESFEGQPLEAPSMVETPAVASNYENFWNHQMPEGNQSSETSQSDFEEQVSSASIPSVSFDEVRDFGNNNKNYEGVLSFDLKIEDIDLSAQKTFLLECIEDSRLGLDLEEVRKRLDSGVLEILDFPAAKTIVLVQRLQGQGFEITWREHVSTQ